MEELENIVGNEEKRRFYRSLVDKFGDLFDETTGRYVDWVDKNWNQHDSVYVFINLEALARDLGNRTKADLIFN